MTQLTDQSRPTMTDLTEARDPRKEAAAILPDGFEPRLIEPGRPAVTTGPDFADDPAALGAATNTTVVTPTTAATTTWDQLAATDPTVAEFARTRWLGAWPALAAVPDHYAAAREDFHRLAYSVVANARREANGKFGLRYTAGGFGTPFFGADEQVRVVGSKLVVQRADEATCIRPRTIGEAATFAGVTAGNEPAENDSPPLGDLHRPLLLDEAVGTFLGSWYGFTASVLEELRSTVGRGDDPGRVQLWPGHFDMAVELGAETAGHRATYGGSPGDEANPEPYLYVGPWGPVDTEDPFWNAVGYPGASLHYAALLAASDPRRAALDFFTTGHALTHG